MDRGKILITAWITGENCMLFKYFRKGQTASCRVEFIIGSSDTVYPTAASRVLL